MLFLGNTASFHLAAWVRIYRSLSDNMPSLWSIHPIGGVDDIFENTARQACGPKLLSYTALGLRVRFTKHKWVHAHGASGYGLAAAISGKPFIATLYGSELFGNHGLVYRSMMRFILHRAKFITVTSEAAESALVKDYRISNRKVRCFHTGLDTDRLDEASEQKGSRTGTTITSIRNAAKHYRTQEIIDSCKALAAKDPHLQLDVILGNGDKRYFEELVQNNSHLNWVTFIPERLEQEEMLIKMASSDVCVSYPVSDQLSSTLLEALYLNRKTVLEPLPSYKVLLDTIGGSGSGIYLVQNGDLSAALEAALYDQAHPNMQSTIAKHFGISKPVEIMREILEKLND